MSRDPVARHGLGGGIADEMRFRPRPLSRAPRGGQDGRLPLRLQPALAERLPPRRARRGAVRVAAAAHTSGDLGLPGRDDAGDDARDARRRARARSRSAGRRPNRLDMRPLTILLTASGVPGCPALIRALRENGEREVRLVGTDMSELAIGRHFCDAFHLVPPGSDPGFTDALVEFCGLERVDAVLPQSSFELLPLAEDKQRFGDTAVLVAGPEAVRRSNDKAETYALLDAIGVRGPAWRRVSGAAACDAAARTLGYPDDDVAFKPL